MTHKTVEIECACGNKRIARRDMVNRGKITCCAKCSHKKASDARRKPRLETALVEAHHTYKCNAKRKGNEFSLSKVKTAELFLGDCYYCGTEMAMGIDRVDNEGGYTIKNSVPCCRICNYAKRDMPISDFLSWIGRVYGNATNKGIL